MTEEFDKALIRFAMFVSGKNENQVTNQLTEYYKGYVLEQDNE